MIIKKDPKCQENYKRGGCLDSPKESEKKKQLDQGAEKKIINVI